MPFTREERQLLEDMVNRIVKQQDRINTLEKDVKTINDFIQKLEKSTAFLELSSEDIERKIFDAVNSIIRKVPIKIHSHLDNKSGGPAFARKGARLLKDSDNVFD